MLPLCFDGASRDKPRLLFLGAHCDDIEIACGGTILQIREQCPDAEIHWVAFSSSVTRRDELLHSARLFLGEIAVARVHTFEFRDGFLPWDGAKVKEAFETLGREIQPDVVFTHRLSDRHQDHRLLGELTWNTWRDHLVLEYEVPKYEGDLGHPNVYVPLTEAQANRKIEILHEAYGTQAVKPWFDPETFQALMRLRGVESRARYAEAFYARKLTLGFRGAPSEPAIAAADQSLQGREA